MLKPMKLAELADLEQMTSTVNAAMDPRLQLLLSRMRSGITKTASASCDENEVAVIAKVTDAKAWTNLSEVRDAKIIGTVDNGPVIATGRIPVPRIEKIRLQPWIISLKAAQPMRPMLAAATKEVEAQPAQLPASHLSAGGKGVIVGVVDYGGDFAHRNFRRLDGKTRLLSLWNQNGGNSPSSPFGYGVEHSPSALNLALNQANPYGAIGYDPGPTSHGTHVMDIAAGNGLGTGVPGMAPDADLIFVNVTHDQDPNSGDVVGKSFGDSVTLLESLKYIFDKAGNRPAVINVSLGTNGGPHDGSTLVEQGIDALVTAAPNRAVVLAASNSYDDGIHARGMLAQNGTIDLVWDVASALFRDIEMEIWYTGPDRIRVELISPNGVQLALALPGETKQVHLGSDLVALVANRLDDPNNHDNMIGIFLASGMPGGQYIVRLTGDTITNGQYHAWIERDNNFQSRFLPPYDNTSTLGSISCSKKVIAVGSYDANAADKALSYFSSSGPTRDGRNKPEISAPGHNVWAALSRSGTGVTRMSGTSMAAPGVTGIVALIFAEAAARGINLTIDQTIQILTQTARKNPPAGNGWHERYGYGRVWAAGAIQAVINLATGGGNSPAANSVSPNNSDSSAAPNKPVKVKAAKAKKSSQPKKSK